MACRNPIFMGRGEGAKLRDQGAIPLKHCLPGPSNVVPFGFDGFLASALGRATKKVLHWRV